MCRSVPKVMAEGSTGTYTGAKSGLVMRGDKPQWSHAFVMLWAADSFWAVQGTIIQVEQRSLR